MLQKKEPLLIIAGFVIFILIPIGIFITIQIHQQNTLFTKTVETSASPYELAQYYFNQDEDPSGPYDLVKARHYYEQVILENVHDTRDAWYQLGRIDFLEGDFDTALYKFNKQIEYSESDTPNVYYLIGLTYGYKARAVGSTEDWQHAEDAFIKYLEYDPTSPWAKVDLSWVYFSQGKFSQMLPVLQQGLSEQPNNPWLLNMYGLALQNTGQQQDAHKYFIHALTEAKLLTKEDWGRSYPGNNPKFWTEGLEAFVALLEHNTTLVYK